MDGIEWKNPAKDVSFAGFCLGSLSDYRCSDWQRYYGLTRCDCVSVARFCHRPHLPNASGLGFHFGTARLSGQEQTCLCGWGARSKVGNCFRKALLGVFQKSREDGQH